ncbi:SNF2-related protein [Streptomyces sp. NPDC058045]|uniref:DEAD/DEAH box helicase n=1 Tax=Streptomyces sp. NPDC058045 TaxID=3346311 RepID=UPI0036E4C2D1
MESVLPTTSSPPAFHSPLSASSDPDVLRELLGCAAVFEPADPPRLGTVAFWRADGTALPAVPGAAAASLTVVLPGEDGVRTSVVPAVRVPIGTAVVPLARARAEGSAPAGGSEVVHPATEFWGAAALLALGFAARGLLLPGISASGHDLWRCAPLLAEELRAVGGLAAAMPAAARAVPLPGAPGAAAHAPRLPRAEPLLRAFLDAVADTLPRSPAAERAAGGACFAAEEPQHRPELRPWADELTAAHDAGVRISLRVEVDGLDPEGSGAEGEAAEVLDGPGVFRVVVQVHRASDAAVVADASEVWADRTGGATGFGPADRMTALVAVRRAVHAWAPLAPLLSAAVPDSVELDGEEVTELLGAGAGALASAGVAVHWPRALARGFTTSAVVGPEPATARGDGSPSLLGPESLLAFNWRFAVGGEQLTRTDLDRLAEANRPLVRLRDRWILVDPEEVRRARQRRDQRIAPVDALRAALTGTAETAVGPVEVEAEGALAELRARLSEPEGAQAVGQPAALTARLRDYQLRGLNWLARMTSLGLGACLADDMGLGKTITLIALHLHRQESEATAGPALVVCPASLLGNWQREIERFAPGTPVRRFHGPRRSAVDLAPGEVVLTTYGTMRLDAEALATAGPWGMLVADEAQHVKNASAATAKALRSIGSQARVALSGTPVENNLSELWAVLDWTTPGLLGSVSGFRARYADAVEGGRDPLAAEQLARLVRPFLLRRHKSDPGIAPELPPKTETELAVSLTPEQAGLYEAVVRETLDRISAAEGPARRGMIIALLTALKQICNHPAQYLKEDAPLLTGRSGKLDLLDELLGAILAEGSAALVFTQYVQMARLLETHLTDRGVPCQLLHGGTPVEVRERMVRRFQDGEVPVFLLSLKAAGTGLNLTRAEHVVHFDRWWNPAVEAQATDRAYRIGQDRPVQVHKLVAEGTVEDRIAEMLARKTRLADAVLGGGGEGALTELGDEELAALVRLRGGDR